MAGQRAWALAVTGAFSARQIAAVLAVGVVGVLIAGLQPPLLGALAREGVLTPGALGLVATVELLAMGVAAGGAGLVLPATRLRIVAALALAAAALLDLATALAGTGAILPLRAAAGLAEGVLIWLAIGFIVRTGVPARWSAIYLMVQTIAQLALATLLGLVIIPRVGASGGFLSLGIVTGVTAIAVPWLPRAYAPLTDRNASGWPTGRGVVALIGVAAWLAFIVAIWVFLEPLAAARGLSPRAIALATPISLGMQVVGAGAATLLAGRLRALPTVTVVAAVELMVLATMAWTSTAAAFVAASAVFGFLWLFVLPFQLPLVIAADRGRRAAALIGGAQLIGSSLGPYAAGVLIGDRDVRLVLVMGAATLTLALLLTLGAGTIVKTSIAD